MIKKILIALTLLASATQMQAQKFALIDLELFSMTRIS